MRANRESETSERRLTAADRQRQALELRKSGLGYEAIAAKVGYSGPSGAYRAVTTALRRTIQEPADELRKIELARLDRAQVAIWPQAMRGQLGAVDRLIKILERRAKLLGLDAPTKVAPTDPSGTREYQHLSDAELAREIVIASAALAEEAE